MNSFFPQQHRISRRSFGVMGLSAAASLGLPGALARAGTTDSTGTGDPSRLVLPPEGGLRLDSADFARLYGPGVFTMSTLYNVPIGTIGTVDRISSLRFRAVIAGSLQKIRLYWPAGPGGYSAGTGGRIRITVLPDDGSDQHLPALDGSPRGWRREHELPCWTSPPSRRARLPWWRASCTTWCWRTSIRCRERTTSATTTCSSRAPSAAPPGG